ncbi:flagellar basal-body rod protein FlgG [Paraneptunicella aestuarii]|uniref:flagellar basal-body rod protein FlgG n=1 Tax=Paraneptunicella aestuarii TaxID=2831148 RepID=UPI001E2D3A40|nr:flagellar basal-body rod protein FlgG [Paraneptunicella aestuarii]UAA37599.1 flagellar basal-body rod protein FlgG [Paraneptunicella aestuarii]
MIESLYIAETGMSSQQQLIDVISNNIANASTPGFKKSQVNFVDLVYQSNASQISAQQSTDNKSNGAGVQIGSNILDFSVGELKQTLNPFDLAIQGNGFLEVTLENGDYAYTRAGRLRLDQDGYLVTKDGFRLSANIQLPPDAVDMQISPDGELSARLGQQGERVVLGNIELARFSNQEMLNSIGQNLFTGNDKTGDVFYGKPGQDGFGHIQQGMTEVSNVSMTEEMVNLMLAQRGYQLNARIIQISDQLLDTVNNLRR